MVDPVVAVVDQAAVDPSLELVYAVLRRYAGYGSLSTSVHRH